MLRRSDPKNHPVFFSAPDDWIQYEPTEQPMRQDGTGHTRVCFVPVRASQISKKVLDPAAVDLTAVLNAGTVIDPSKVAHAFNISDPADIDAKRESLGYNMYQYLLKHKDEIKPASKAEVEVLEEK